MIGDKLILQPYHFPPAKEIVDITIPHIESDHNSYFISIGGESGCGKSTLAVALKTELEKKGHSTFVLHMDDYFHLPPTTNHDQRIEDINHVGPQEVDMEQLQIHINEIRAGVHELIKPLVHYKENEIRREIFYPKDHKVFIVEGTYVTQLSNIDTKIFMNRDYKETLPERIARARDPLSPFVEEVLEIEHQIIKQQIIAAHILVNKDYEVSVVG